MAKAFKSQLEGDSPILVRDLESGQILGRLVQLTSLSMTLETAAPLVVGDTFHCYMELTKPILGQQKIYFQATAHACRDQSSDGYSCELASLIADPGDIDALEMLILHFAIRDL